MAQAAPYYIVWNASRTEGFVTDDEQDALQCAHAVHRTGSTAGIAFAEAYEDDERIFERVDITQVSA